MILNKYDKKSLVEYLHFCKKYRNIDMEKTYNLTLQTIKYYKGDQRYREILREGQEIEKKWYDSLKKNKPDYSLYNHDHIIIEIWACWVAYSRKYIKLINKPEIFQYFKNVKSIADVGCGFGYTTAALKQSFPNANVIGTNLKNSIQYKIAQELGKKYGFTLYETIQSNTDLIFASEYFEHIENPIEHLQEILEIGSPKILIIANTFGQKSMGHFNYYKHNEKLIENKKMGRLFNTTLRGSNYKQLKTGFWNNRPNIWIYES